MKLVIPEDYPVKPPQVTFTTKVFHPNISSVSGEICMDILKAPYWTEELTLDAVVISVLSLLTDANADDPLIPEVGRLY